MLRFLVMTLWLWANGGGAVPARDKPFYPESTHALHFENFKAMYHKQYSTPEEEQHRFNAFKKNLATINELNADDEYATYDINEEADLDVDEIEAKYKNIDLHSMQNVRDIETFSPDSSVVQSVPESFDWREKGVISMPRDQKNCKASYAIATVGCIESNYAMLTNKHVNLSAQQAIDCDKRGGGCKGGNPELTLLYYHFNGIMKEDDYKYVGTHNKCAYDSKKLALAKSVIVCGRLMVLERFADFGIYNFGPLVALIDGRQLQWYKGGIVTKCSSKGLNYAVLLTGYGHEKDLRYWSVQNSRGQNWGEKGYARLKRGIHCLGITRPHTLFFTQLNQTNISENV